MFDREEYRKKYKEWFEQIQPQYGDVISKQQDAISEYNHAQNRLSNTMDSFELKKYECGQDLSVTKAESEDLQRAIKAVEEGEEDE